MAEFASFAEMLRVPQPAAAAEAPEPAASEPLAPAAVLAEDRAAARVARLFQARLADTFDDLRVRLLRDLASDVLARELRLAPADIAAVVERLRCGLPVLRVRCAAADRAQLHNCESVIDPALQPGDVVVELTGGSCDLRLGTRLAAVLEAFA